MPSLRICIDVPDLASGERFYASALGLRPGRRYRDAWLELLGAAVPVDLLANPPGSKPVRASALPRTYARHWTPVHLDVEVDALDPWLARALAAGARLEGAVEERPWGRLATCADPFGHGFCLLEFRGRGYDTLIDVG